MNREKNLKEVSVVYFEELSRYLGGKYWGNPRRNPIVNTSHKYCRL